MESLLARKNKNRLLVKDDVGKAKPCVLKLPPQEFVYGKPDTRVEEGVAGVTGRWDYPKKSRGITSEVDFRKLNKYAASKNSMDVRHDLKSNANFQLNRRQPGYISGIVKTSINMDT